MDFWLLFGYRLAALVFTTSVSLVCGAFIFMRWVAPTVEERYAEAQETITNLAKLAGVKSQEYTGAKTIEKLVAADLLKNKFPEWEAIKMVLSPDTVDQVESSIEENPEIAMQLYKKYGHYLGGAPGAQSKEELPDF